MRRLLDLSHTVTDRMVTYKGLPGPVIGDHLTREASRLHDAGEGKGIFPFRAYAEL